MFITSSRLNLENEHIGDDTALRVRTLQCVIHSYLIYIIIIYFYEGY